MSQRRIAFVILLILAGFILLEIKLFHLQILQASYYQVEAQKRSTRIELIPALRGKILDRQGKTLVGNLHTFELYCIPEQVDKSPEVITLLAKLLKVNQQELTDRLKEIEERILTKTEGKSEREKNRILRQERRTPAWLLSNISLDNAIEIKSYPRLYRGILVREKLRRHYLYGTLACHILGYLGQVSPEKYKEYLENGYFWKYLDPRIDEDTYQILRDKGEFMSQQMGCSGVEKRYEEKLLGINGVRMVEVDYLTRTEKELSSFPSMDGIELQITIDLALQQKIEQLLTGKTGSVIVLGVQDGEIWAMASSPAFNPNLLQSPVSTATVQYIFNNPQKPLYNRAISGEYAPGSLFKLVTATAGLESKKINAGTHFNCTGYLSPNLKHFKCWTAEYNRGHGSMDIISGIQHSCNIFFFNTGKNTGHENILGWASKYGFGKKTGFDITGENIGLLPSPEQKLKRSNKRWATADTLNISIGQGDLMVTPLQVVRMMAAIANGGKLVQPHLIKDKKDVPASASSGQADLPPPENLNISSETLSLIRRGLYEVVHGAGGTAGGLGLDNFSVAGKTSTAEVSTPEIPRKPHAWFVGFAPYDKPRFAFVVMIEHGGKGSEAAAPIAAGFVETAMEVK